jgi:hypothetical protein
MIAALAFALLLGSATPGPAHAVQASPSTCMPPFWGGVLAGSSIKEDVLRLYGPGISAPEEGDTGGSYYLDAKGSVTLHAVYYTDTIVGELEVIEGNALPPSARKRPEAVSPNLKPPFLHAGLPFGSTEEAVLAAMGQPTRKEKEGDSFVTFIYLSACRCELESGISFVFKNSRLVKIVYWHETG